MSKKRYIDTKFWSDGYVRKLNPLERYLFVYILTNEHTNISGIYELPIDFIAFETGIDQTVLPVMLERLREKIIYVNGWVAIKNFIKYQSDHDNVKKGIEHNLASVPKEIMQELVKLGYTLEGSDHDLTRPSNYSNSNLYSNSNIATKVAPKQKVKTDIQQLVEHFFTLKGWTLEEKRSVFARFTKPAKELLELCDLQQAKEWLSILADWAKRTELDWSLSTMLKKWPERQTLAEKKQATFEGNRVIEKLGKLYVIGKDGEKREFAGKKEQLIYI